MSAPSRQRVAVLGASDNPERYSFKAFTQLREHGHDVFPVHPSLREIGGVSVASSLGEVPPRIDTLTVYVNPSISAPLAEEIVALNPGRVIFNPGTESPALKETLEAAGIPTLEACTLVLLSTNQFDS